MLTMAAINAIVRRLERSHASEPGVAETVARINQQNYSLSRTRLQVPRRQPACRHLANAIARAWRVDKWVSGTLGDIMPLLRWQCIPRERKIAVPPDFMTDYAYAQIVGPEGIFSGKDFSMGLFIVGPEQNYPEHEHLAPELYWLLSGPTAWSFDNSGQWSEVREGTVIWNEPHKVHATRTMEIPMLAFWCWIRDINGPYTLLGQPAKPL